MKYLRGFLAALSAAFAFVAACLAPIQTSSAATVVINSFAHATSGVPTSGDADVQDWLDRVYAAGGTVSGGTQTAVETFVASAKSNGYFSTFRRLNLFAGTGVAYLHPLVNTSGAAADTASGAGITYAESTGPVTDGASYIDTGYTPTTETGGLSVYMGTATTSNTTIRIPIGCRDAGNAEYYRISHNASAGGSGDADAGRGRWGDNSSTLDAGDNGAGVAAAMWHINRESTTSLKAYKNGAQIGSTITAAATPATPSQPIWLFGSNSAGSLGAPLEASAAIRSYGIHDLMTDTQAGNYYTDLHAFNTAMGRAF